jgi:PAS domain S-box-containing protein
VNIVRIHKPETSGDLIERFTMREAQRTGKTSAGIELGPLGTFALRAVEPVFDEDGLLGFVELGKEIEGILDALASRHRIDIAVVVHKDLLNRQAWEASMATLGRKADWDRFPEDTLIYNSLSQLPTVLDSYVNGKRLADTDAKLELTFGGTSRRVVFLPLMDVSDSEVGHFIILYDISDRREACARLLRIVGAGCLLLFVLLLGFFYVVLKNTDRGIEARTLALRESEAKWRSITENSADCILLLSPKLEISFISRNLPGLAIEPLCGMSMLDFMPVESRHAAKACFEQVLKTGRPAKYIGRHPLATGQMGYFESTVGPVLCNGKVAALVVCVRDVTDRKRAEEALQQESLFRKAVIANVAEGLCVCHEIPDSPFWAFTVWNGRMAEITGYTVDEINCSGWYPLMPADAAGREQVAACLERVRLGEEVRGEEWTFIRRDGQERVLLVSTSLLVSNGCQMHTLALVEDVTERKRAEQDLRETLARTERTNHLMEGREVRVLELKRRINELSVAAGQSPPHKSPQDNDLGDLQAEDPTAQASLMPAAEGQLGNYSIGDLLDRDSVQRLLNSYCDAVGISSAIVDAEGNVFVGARWQRICTDFHRINPETCARCTESDTVLAGQLEEGEGFSLYRCRNGLTDAASPIIIEGRHVANVFVGQFLPEPADAEFFRRQAKEFGFDEAAYMEALSRVPVVSKQKLPAILSYLTTCARLLAEMGLKRIRTRVNEADLLRQAEELNHANQVVRAQGEAALSLAEDANEARAAAECARHSLQESEERLRTVIEAARDAIVMMGPDREVTLWSPGAEAIFGWRTEEVLGRPVHQLLAPARFHDALTKGLDVFRTTGHGGAVGRTLEMEAKHKDGHELPVELSLSAALQAGRWCAVGIVRDISERRQLEKCVQSQLQLLHSLMDAIPYAVYYKDTQLRYLGCNQAFAKLLGMTQDQIAGKTIHDIAPKELADRYHAADLELLAHRGFQTYKGLLPSADGVHHEVLFRKATFQNVEDGVGGIVGVVLDTTELMRAEEALLVKNSALNSAASGIVLMDLDGRLTYANPSCLRMWGFDHEHEVLGKLFMSLLRCEKEEVAVHQSALDVGTWHGELVAQRKDGSEFIVQVSANPVRDKQGKPICLMASLVDVTESRRLRDILDRKQKNLEAIFDAAPLGMLLVNEQRRVVRANDAIRQISGKGYRDILNQHPCQVLARTHGVSELASPDSCASCETCSLRNLVEATFESGLSVHGVETRPTLSRNGKQVRPWFSVSLEPVHIDGDSHILIALHDITGRKEAEAQLGETMEMKSQFISTVSHELRAPLAAMKEAVIIVADGIAGKINKDQTRFLDIARRNIDRLGRLIDDVLDFQKLSAVKMKFHMQPNPIDKTIDDACSTMQPQARQKQLHLSVDLESNLPAIAYDHDRIIQVLTNLLSNAIKFTPEGGRIVLSARRQAEHLAISVSDTGMGIPQEALPRIFTQFYRVHRPGKEIKGTGLGLAIVHKIVTGHGGRIDIESELNKGTTFTVLLPLTPKQPAEDLSPQSDACMENTVTPGTRT